MTDISSRAGSVKNVRKSRYASVLYWIVFYAYCSIIGTKYYLLEEATVSAAFSWSTTYMHVALLASIILGFALLRRRDLTWPKRILNLLSVPMLILGAATPVIRYHVAYLVVLAVLLGQLSTCSLLTYIYEMNNSERLYGIVGAHILVALLMLVGYFFDRTTAVFWWVVVALSVVAAVACWLEGGGDDPMVIVQEDFVPKLYVPLFLACIGGFVTVLSSMILVEISSVTIPSARLFYFGGALLGAILYFVIYRYIPTPASVSLILGFTASALALALFMLVAAPWAAMVACVVAGATVALCMMNLYYILCNVIKKYRRSPVLKLAPILMNAVGAVMGVILVVVYFYAPALAQRILLGVCLGGNIVIIATYMLWSRGLSVTAQQEEYIRLDATMTRTEAYRKMGLTEQEINVANMILEGKALKDIADALFISPNTAKTHRLNVYRKMQVSSREELADKMSSTLPDAPQEGGEKESA